MGNHSTTWPCLGGSKRVAYLVFCTSLGTPCDTGGWEDFDSNSIVFHSLQVKLWGDMGDGSGTLPESLVKVHTCILLFSSSYIVLSVLDMWSLLEIIWNIGLSWHSWVTLVLWQGWSEFPAWRSTWCCAVTKQRSRRYDLMDGPKVIAQLGHSQLKRTDEWKNVIEIWRNKLMGALFVERFTYTPENFYNQDIFFDNRGG